jgi:hypothetical protein
MKLWTYHPSDFPVDEAKYVDWTRGYWWNQNDDPHLRERYRVVLPEFQKLVGEKQFIWCCTTAVNNLNTMNFSADCIEWEIVVPLTSVLRFYDNEIWEGIVRDEHDNWGSLFLTGLSEATAADQRVGAVAYFPVRSGSIRRIGPVPVYDAEKELDERKRRASELYTRPSRKTARR